MNNIESIDGIGEYVPNMISRHAKTIDAGALPAIYVVHAKRWGESETHNYIVAATLKESEAITAAEFEEYQRGGKYGCEVSCFNCGEKTIIRKSYNGEESMLESWRKST